MLSAILCCFAISLLFLVTKTKKISLLVAIASLTPLGLLLWFAHFISAIAQGHHFDYTISWIPLLGVNLSWHLDGLSNLFALLISAIGTIVVSYSGAYFRNLLQLRRFYSYLFLFMGAMFGLVLANNLVVLLIFWELTSLSSFLLIGFNYHHKANQAALQSFWITAAGGLALLVGILLINRVTASFNLTQLLLHHLQLLHSKWYAMIVILVLLGALTKSAQFPFHFWLPRAMQAPTPVSAYLHSATMVQAGVYLIARLTPILGHSHLWFILLTGFGALTMLTTSIMALKSHDLKQMLAYSTTMALGLLFFLLASGKTIMMIAALVFLLAHGLYKAGLFIAVGNIEKATGSRDIRALSGLRPAMPLTFLGVLLCAASMAGLPPLLGFVSKELLYEAKLSLGINGIMMIIIAIMTNIVFAVIAIMITWKPFLGKPTLQPRGITTVAGLAVMALAIVSLIFGMWPSIIDSALVVPAVKAITIIHGPIGLMWWHGLTPALGLSSATIIAATIISYGIIKRLNYRQQSASANDHNKTTTLTKISNCINHIGPENISLQSWYYLQRLSQRLTLMVQDRSASCYLVIMFTAIIVIIGGPLLLLPWHLDQLWPKALPWFDGFLIVLMWQAAFAIVVDQSHIASMTFLGMVGICTTVIFTIYSAPDVAITQIVIDILTVVMMVLALYRLPSLPKVTTKATLWIRNAIIAIMFGVMITLLLLAAVNLPFNHAISHFYNHYALPLAYGHNVVNVILVDFRGFDTLGEIIVIAIAGIGIYGLLKVTSKKKT